ncbi:MAG: hypothetical protein R6U38_08175 [Desulfatiglandaceae bacterium]
MDWFTVVAQIVNFLILVALLKYFLYDRIIQAMDDRESRIQDRLEEAKQKSRQAEAAVESYREKERNLKAERQQVMDQAKQEAEKIRKDLAEKAREEGETLRNRWRESVQKERERFLRDLRQMAAKAVYGISRQVLWDLADRDIEEQIAETFLSQMKAMPLEKKDRLGKAIRNNDNRVRIASGFEPASGTRQKITRAVREELSKAADVTYETDTDLIMGMELKGYGEKLAWSIETYLEDLENKAQNMLEQQAASQAERLHEGSQVQGS